MFLAVFHLDDLLCPVKVLTHLDDIEVALRESEIRCESRGALAGLDRSVHEHDEQLLERATLTQPREHECRDVLRVDGLPAYADASDEQVEPEAIAGGSVVWHFVRGYGQLVVRAEDTLSVLECGPGNEVQLSAGTRHWFRPAPGQRCVIVRAAKCAEALQRRPSGSDLAARFPGFGL